MMKKEEKEKDKKGENEEKVEDGGADKFDEAINMLTAFSEAAKRLGPKAERRMNRAMNEAIFGGIFGMPTPRRRGRRR